MSASASRSSTRPAPLEYVDRVAASRAFGGSAALPRLLRYLGERAVAEPGETIKEFRIATEALGRGERFDSRTDSVVRVTTARLRSKLEEYYADEGAQDDLRLQIPKGSYQLLALPAEPRVETPPPEQPRRPAWTVPLLLGAGMALFAAGYYLGSQAGPAQPDVDPEISRFWSAFANSPGGVRVVYSNVPHSVTSYGRVLTEPVADIQPDDWHTGVGEVQAVHRLASVAQNLNLAFDLKRALLVDWDEVVDVHVVYLGGPGANPQVADLGANANFVFERAAADAGQQYFIRNRSPAPGEAARYQSDLPLTVDYAVIRLTPGFRSERWTLLLAGITTFGTAAAAETVSAPRRLEQMRTMLEQSLDDPLRPFECLVEVDVKDNVPLGSRLSACRLLAAD